MGMTYFLCLTFTRIFDVVVCLVTKVNFSFTHEYLFGPHLGILFCAHIYGPPNLVRSSDIVLIIFYRLIYNLLIKNEIYQLWSDNYISIRMIIRSQKII